MNSFTYENQGTSTYLVYRVKETDIIDSMSLGMITNNKIPGLANVSFTQLDNQKFIKFNVSAKVSVDQFFSGVVNRTRLIGVFSGILDALIASEDYMIDAKMIDLNLEHIFTDVSTCETLLICLPIMCDEKENTDYGMFFKNIVFSTQFDQTENCDYVAKIINYLNSAPVFSLYDFKVLIDDLRNMVKNPQLNIQKNVINNPQPAVQHIQQSPVPKKTVHPQQLVHSKVQINKPQPIKIEPVAVTPVQPQILSGNNTNSFAIPNQEKINIDKTSKNKDAKPMSMFYLLQHYNKDNAAQYKAQKAQKKNNNKEFAVPGQDAPPVIQTPQEYKQPIQVSPVQVQPVQAQNIISQSVIPNSVTMQNNIVCKKPSRQSINFGETTVLGNGGSGGETTVLSGGAQQVAVPHLIRKKNNEKIILNKPVFRIGKERSYVDYFIGDNTAISRSHANIISRDEQYFVVDTNSTNHTYINGGMIQSSVETRLSHGDKIKLANEEFEFKIY